MLARESFVEADIVSSVPESGTAAAHGFSTKVSILNLFYWTIGLFWLLLFSVQYSICRSIV